MLERLEIFVKEFFLGIWGTGVGGGERGGEWEEKGGGRE